MDLTPEEVLGQLKTRGFETGFQRTPLREFWGKLDSITGSMVERFTPARLEVIYNFSDLEVIASTEPYAFPVAQITIMHSNRKQSAMGIFGASVDKIINVDVAPDADPSEVKGQDYLLDKRQHWKMTGGHMMWDGQTKTEVARECWEVIEIEGEATPEPAEEPAPAPVKTVKPVAKATPVKAAPAKVATKGGALQEALKLLDGKTEQAFYQAAFANPVIKADGALVTKIINREFLAPLVEAEQFMLDEEGVYHKA